MRYILAYFSEKFLEVEWLDYMVGVYWTEIFTNLSTKWLLITLCTGQLFCCWYKISHTCTSKEHWAQRSRCFSPQRAGSNAGSSWRMGTGESSHWDRRQDLLGLYTDPVAPAYFVGKLFSNKFPHHFCERLIEYIQEY